MSVKVTLSCDGCHVETGPHRLPHREFHSINGRGHGFGVWKEPTMADVTPESWVLSDPYTGCTYCPTCWAEIAEGEAV
jgi:hypothetical protein